MEDLFEPRPFEWKKYSVVAIRRRWWILGPFLALGVLGFAVALLWPPVYRSEAMILVEQQKIPAKYVTPNVMSDIDSRLQTMTEEILSRTRLESLIKQLNLYAADRQRKTTDELVDRMRADTTIQVAEAASKDDQSTAFRIYFCAGNPHVAKQVNTELTSLFIEKSLEARAQQSISTTNFLQSQLEQARKDLATQEEQLRQYKMRYLGELPQQEQSNLQILNSLQSQLQSVTDSIGRAEQQRIYLQSLRSEYQAMAQPSGLSGGSNSDAPASVADSALRDLRKQLGEAEAKYTPQHPDVVRLKEQISQWEQRKQRSAQSASTAKTNSSDSAAHTAADQPALAEVESRLKALEVEIANSNQQAEKLRKQIDDVRSRLSLTPVREQQLAEVTRNYQNSHEYYQSLLQKELESELATNLEKRQEGEQFRIIDPPSLPDRPFKPNRPFILFGAWICGLCLGIGAASLREFVDNSFKGEREVAEQTRLPVLARIPVFLTAQEKKSKKLLNVIEVAAVALLALASIAVTIYTWTLS